MWHRPLKWKSTTPWKEFMHIYEIVEESFQKIDFLWNVSNMRLFTYQIMHVLLFFDHPTPTYGYVFANILLNRFSNSYILLTTHPPPWHNVVCEGPLLIHTWSNSIWISSMILYIHCFLHLFWPIDFFTHILWTTRKHLSNQGPWKIGKT